MTTCKLQVTIVSSQFIDKEVPKERASVELLARNKFKVKVPQLTTTYTPLPMLPLTEKAKDIIVETESTNSAGKFGRFGGKFVPETLVMCLNQLEAEFKNALRDQVFQAELATSLRDYVGRETPLYHAQRLSDYDCQAHIGLNSVVTATGSGQHGVATASACAKLDLECTVFMAAKDMDRQSSNVRLMKLLGAKVEAINGSFKNASSEAFRCWVENLENSYHLTGSAVGPHTHVPPWFDQMLWEKWVFNVYHGAISYLLQDDDGQIIQPHSIAAGMEYPGVGPELSFLKDSGRVEFCAATDEEALDAYERLCKLEGIYPSLEATHAFAI
ncbi:tryptophan synthase beta chain [Trifolium repens]|nr:tryptophan synthase beta chain [Trifolium repens]